MTIVALFIGFILMLVIVWDMFETVVLPRSVTQQLRITRLFYRYVWRAWSATTLRLPPKWHRELWLGAFGPLSLPLLLGVWAVGLIISFALMQWGMGSPLHAPERHVGFWTDLYMSGTTFFTLGYGDVIPKTTTARLFAVTEAGIGFGFLGVVIGYLPVLYQSFSRREVGISLFDARAGSPPTAVELLRRHSQARQMSAMGELLRDGERWASDLLESHLSYPVLAYYRSQHERQSWLSVLTVLLDTCALILVGFEEKSEWGDALTWQARMTFAMARHAVVDISLILNTPPHDDAIERLAPTEWPTLCLALQPSGVVLKGSVEEWKRVRREYEPYVVALAERLYLPIPPWITEAEARDNWQTSAWDHPAHF